MTKTQLFKNKAVNLASLYGQIKRRLLEDDFRLTSEVQTEHVYHMRGEKTGVTEIIIGAVRDIELIIAGEPDSFAVIFTVGAWGKNIVSSGSTGFIVTSLVAGPAAVYGGLAATTSYIRAVAYEGDFWKEIEKYIDLQSKASKRKQVVE
ncbi:hypothetical protein JXL21_11485 [Candidatus Bathyarchaeota archaeon]|nr:hypothetical protein [Candidatus Bathyarchaeota archaeon]